MAGRFWSPAVLAWKDFHLATSRPTASITITATAPSPTLPRKRGSRDTGWCYGVCVGDYDNDGHDDLFLTYYGRNVLYHNNGDGTFTDVTEKAGLLETRTRFGAGCTFVDYDRDGFLDLFVSRYIELDLAKTPVGGSSRYCKYKDVPVNCGPLGLQQETCTLYHNNGNGTFTDVSAKAGIAEGGPPLRPYGCGFRLQQ